VQETRGQLRQEIEGTDLSDKKRQTLEDQLSKRRSSEVNRATPTGENQWSEYPETMQKG
jgi:Mn-containing catalase